MCRGPGELECVRTAVVVKNAAFDADWKVWLRRWRNFGAIVERVRESRWSRTQSSSGGCGGSDNGGEQDGWEEEDKIHNDLGGL